MSDCPAGGVHQLWENSCMKCGVSFYPCPACKRGSLELAERDTVARKLKDGA